MNNKVLVISPHADDVTIFIGGIVRKLANQGMKIYVARVTNDDYDSYGLDVATTIYNNRIEAEDAYRELGVSDVIHMGYQSDYIMSADYNELRGSIVKLIRDIKPLALYNFDIDGKCEDNMDHKIISRATAEALWISSFDLHYSEQLKGDIEPYSVPSRLKFAREADDSYKCEDISDVIDIKINALKKHKSVMNNMLMQPLLRAKSMGANIDDIKANLDIDSMIEDLGRKQAQMIGAPHGIQFGEMIKEEGLGLAQFFL